MQTEIKKELKNTGILVQNAELTPEQEKIKILEGILAATEKRLLYYIEKEKKEGFHSASCGDYTSKI